VRVALEDRLAQIEERAEAEERRRIERIYSNTRFVEWLFYGLIFLPISLALYVLSDYSGKLEKWAPRIIALLTDVCESRS
jgi:hypothetical protein